MRFIGNMGSNFTEGGLYIVLRKKNTRTALHWSYFIPDPAVEPLGVAGTYFHLADCGYDVNKGYQVAHMLTHAHQDMVLAAQIADLATFGAYNIIIGELTQIFATMQIAQSANTHWHSCMQWIYTGLDTLHELGFIHCESPTALAEEILSSSLMTPDDYIRQHGGKVIITKNCS